MVSAAPNFSPQYFSPNFSDLPERLFGVAPFDNDDEPAPEMVPLDLVRGQVQHQVLPVAAEKDDGAGNVPQTGVNRSLLDGRHVGGLELPPPGPPAERSFAVNDLPRLGQIGERYAAVQSGNGPHDQKEGDDGENRRDAGMDGEAEDRKEKPASRDQSKQDPPEAEGRDPHFLPAVFLAVEDARAGSDLAGIFRKLKKGLLFPCFVGSAGKDLPAMRAPEQIGSNDENRRLIRTFGAFHEKILSVRKITNFWASSEYRSPKRA